MQKLYKVTLTSDERTELKKLVSSGKNNAHKIKHAHILLAIDATEHGKISDNDAAKQFHCHPAPSLTSENKSSSKVSKPLSNENNKPLPRCHAPLMVVPKPA